MTVLGLSFGFHDSTAAIVAGGRLLAATPEERLSLQKHDNGFPQASIEACLKKSGLTLADMTQVAFYETPEDKFTRIFASSLANFPNGQKEWRAAMGSWLGQKLWTRATIAKKLALPLDQVVCLEHHQSHAAQAFLGSGLGRSAILIIDAVGEWASTSLWLGDLDAKKPLSMMSEQRYPHSLGLFYSAMTAFLGFKPMNDECSVMALAAFGRPAWKNFFIDKLLRIDEQGTLNLDPSYLNFNRFLAAPWTRKLVHLLGPPRDARAAMALSSFEDSDKQVPTPAEQHFADIAASVQAAYTEAVLRLVRHATALCNERRLCLAGGGALNCVTNQSLLASGLIDDLYIPADPGDGGAAIGAAMLVDLQTRQDQGSASDGCYRWGPFVGTVEPEKQSTLALIAQLKPSRFQSYAVPGFDPGTEGRFRWEKAGSDEELLEKVAGALAAGNIVGWMQGPGELGPRALGGRSLLFRSDNQAIAHRVSTQIKHRALYRPYALSMTENQAERVIIGYQRALVPYRWMQLTAPVQADAKAMLRSGLHSDGTTRPQVVLPDENPLFHRLLEKFEALSGLPALVNTSFNESGYPIVEKPVDAAVMFVRTAIDCLVVGREILVKDLSNKGIGT